jgi:hypothetical protein
MRNKGKKFLIALIYCSMVLLWQSPCRCKQDKAAREALFAPGSIKFQKVNRQ